MADDTRTKSQVTTYGTAILRKRPSLLLMKMTLHAAEATLELGLANIKKQCEAASRWLQRLNADQIEFGEPHFAIPFDGDPMRHAKLIAAATTRKIEPFGSKSPTAEPKRDVHMILTAMWNIDSMSAEETLIFFDRLRFEATTIDATPNESPLEPPAFTSPEEQVCEMIATMAQIAEPPKENLQPQFLFIARLPQEQLVHATHEAISQAREQAEKLAESMEMRLGTLINIHQNYSASISTRTDQVMERQRCGAILAGSSFVPEEHDIISEDPRSAIFRISVMASYCMEQPSKET